MPRMRVLSPSGVECGWVKNRALGEFILLFLFVYSGSGLVRVLSQ